jgi:hypothetical protein
MSTIISKFPMTFAGIVSGTVLAALVIIFNLELFENVIALLASLEKYEIDEFILPLFLIMLGIVGDNLLSAAKRNTEEQKLKVYNQMSGQIVEEISSHLNKLLEFRAALKEEAPSQHDLHHEMDRMIIKSFSHYEQMQRKTDVSSDFLPLVLPSESEANRK